MITTGRIHSVDVMRGIAIFGILFVNILSFHTPIIYINPSDGWSNWDHLMDYVLYTLMDLFIQGSLYPLFALLFGVGFVLFRERVLHRDWKFPPYAIRRILFLLMLGILHAFLVWSGDILITYAVFGFIFLFFIRLSGKILMWLGILFYSIPNLFILSMNLLREYMGNTSALEFVTNLSFANNAVKVYETGNFLDISLQRITDWNYVNNDQMFIVNLFIFVPTFLFAAGITKLGLLENYKKHKLQFVQMMTILFVLSITFKMIPYFFGINLLTVYLQDTYGGFLQAITYAMAIMYLYDLTKTKVILKPFIALGRMSLTNFLMQTIVFSILFFGYGFGFYGILGVWEGTLIALGLGIFQLVFSNIWLYFFTNGPVEWLQRVFTYDRKFAFVKKRKKQTANENSQKKKST